MDKDIKNSSKNQTKWDEELQELVKKAKKAKKYFPGFAVKGQVQVYEQIVHELWNLSPAATKVLLFIARQTIGWGKDFDRITINQIEKGIRGKDGKKLYFLGVGLTKPTIAKALRELDETGYIIKMVICPGCNIEVPQISKKVQSDKKEYNRKQVQARCPYCQAELLGNELIYYGLHFRPNAYDPSRVKKFNSGGVKNFNSQVSKPSIKNHHPQDHVPNVQGGASQVGNDDEGKIPEGEAPQSQASNHGHSSHDQSVRDAHTLTDKAERVVETFRRAFGPPRGMKECVAELNEMVEVFGEQAFLNEIEKVVELGIKPSTVKYIMTCVVKNWDGTCPACEGWGMNNRTPDGRCPLCQGQRHFNEYSELKRARSKMAK